MQTTTAEVRMSGKPARIGWRALLSPAVIALGALLALQLLAALALELGGPGMEPAGSQGPLLAFDREKVTGIGIQAPGEEPVRVTEVEGGWIIPSLQDLPAAEHKVTELLSKLASLQKGLPVATSEESLKRFKVADRTFERKVTLESGDSPPTILYLGDSPGFRRLFVRAEGDNAVYEAELGLFDAPDKADDWSDRTLLYLKAEDIQKLAFAEITLERKDDAWRLADLAKSEEQDEQAIEDTVRSLTNIDFVGVLEENEKPAIDKDTAPVEIDATLASGETIHYRIAKLAQGNDYLLEVSNRPQRFTLASYAAKDLTGMNRANLLKKKEEAAESTPKEPPPLDAIGSGSGSAEPSPETTTSTTVEVQDATETSRPDLKSTETQTGSSPPETPGKADAQPER